MLGDSIRRRRHTRAPGAGVDTLDVEGRAAGSPPARPHPGAPGSTARRWLTWIGIALLVLVTSFGIGYALASQLLFPRPETAGVGIAVPSLYGMEMASAERALAAVGLRVGTVTELASVRVRAGRVVAQEPIPDQQLRPGGEVSLAVSQGAPEARVPPVAGLGGITAQRLLESAGFEVSTREVRSGGAAPGRVVRTEPEAGQVVRLPATLTLMVNVGPEEMHPTESPVADTGAPAVWP
jgi:beta-lactam-binding protein with PASTA domain